VEGIWQLHRVPASDAAHNAQETMIANLEEGAADEGKGIKVTASKDGTFSVINQRNGFSQNYKPR
jgi:hypothetical protein